MLVDAFNLVIIGLLILMTSSNTGGMTVPKFSITQRQDQGYKEYFNYVGTFGLLYDPYQPRSFPFTIVTKREDDVNLDIYMKCAFAQWRSLWQSDNQIMRNAKYLSFQQETPVDGVQQYRVFYQYNGMKNSITLSEWDFNRMLIFTPTNVRKKTFEIESFSWSQVRSDPMIYYVNMLLTNRSKIAHRTFPRVLNRCRGRDNKNRVYFQSYEIQYQFLGLGQKFFMTTDWNQMILRRLIRPSTGLPNFRYTDLFKTLFTSVKLHLIELQPSNITDMIIGSTNLTCSFRINVYGFLHFKMQSGFTGFNILNYQPNKQVIRELFSLEAQAFDRIARKQYKELKFKKMIVFGGGVNNYHQQYYATYQTPEADGMRDQTANEHISLKVTEVHDEMKIHNRGQ